MNHRLRCCLTGGIACGKSLLSSFLNARGVETLDADDIVHELIPLAERRRLAKEVFADPEKRRALEARIHPLVKERLNQFLSEPPQDGFFMRMAVIPLLFECKWDAEYDIIVSVISPREEQIQRMITRRGYTRAEAESRLAAQMDVQEKARRSHYTILNEGSVQSLEVAADRFVAWLKERMTNE